MSIKNLSQRLDRLESAGASDFGLGWGDLVEMVARLRLGEITRDSPEYLDFLRRPLKPWLARVMAEEIPRIEAIRARQATKH